jgi:WD40 repeat protein
MNFYDAFISYGRADSKEFAINLNEKLTAAGLNVWFDQNDIPPAVDYQKQIDDGIEKAHNFLFIISPHSVNSPYCLKEIELAIKLNKRIIPLLHVEQISQEVWQQRNLDQTLTDWHEYQKQGLHHTYNNPKMHLTISKINSIYFRENIDDFSNAFTKLLTAIDKHQDYVEQHTNFLVKALEWSRNQQQTNYFLVGEERGKAEKWLKQRFIEAQPPCIPTDLHCEFICESIKNSQNLLSQVFLAASDTDEAIKDKIRKTLMRESITVWTNKTDIKTGTAFSEAINQGIEGADNFVYLISLDSLKSEYCQQELNLALANNKRIIPLLVAETDLELIPLELKKLQFIDFTQSESAEKYRLSADKLLQELKKEPSYYEKHKILLVKARKWQKQNQNPSLLLRGYNRQHFEAWLKGAKKREDYPPLPLQEEFITASLNKPEEFSLEVFISYSRTDSDLARKLNDALQELGKTTWFDQESIATGTDFQQEINRGIASSDNFLFIISPKSVNSPYCADEVEYAQKLGKRFVTIRHRPLSDDDKLHPALASVQWLDFYHQHGGEFSANFNELVRTLDTDREHIRSHTKWSQRALEWQEKDKNADLLLRGSEFAIAEEWLKTAETENKNPAATDLQREFIAQSWEAIKAQEKQDKHQLLVLRSLLTGAIVLLVAAIGTSGFAFLQKREAEAQKVNAEIAKNQAQTSEQKAKNQTAIATQEKLNAQTASDKAQKSEQEAKNQATIANTEKQNAVIASDKAQKSEQEAKNQAIIANTEKQNAVIATNKAQKSEQEAKKQATIATQEKSRAEIASNKAKKNEQEAKKQLKQAQLNQAESLGRYSLSLFNINQKFDASIQAIKAGIILKTQKLSNLVVMNALQAPLGDRSEKNRLEGHSGTVISVSVSRDGKTLASGSQDKTIKLWNLDTGKEIRTLSGHTEDVWSVSFSPDGKTLASGSDDNTIKLWNLDTGKEISTLSGHTKTVNSVSFSPDGKTLASGSDDNTIKLWNLDTGKEIRTLSGHTEDVWSVSFDGKTLASGSRDSTIKLWNLDAGKEIRTLSGHTEDVMSVSFSPDGKTLASGSDDNTIKLWNLDTGKEIRTLSGHTKDVFSVSFSPDGKTLASGSRDSTIKLWNLDTGKEIRTLSGHTNSVMSVSFSPDGKTLASGSWDKTIKLWNLDTGKEIRTLSGHTKTVRSVSFSPDGKTLASGSWDKTIKLWNLDTGKEICTLSGHTNSVYSVSFSPDGKTLASGSGDKTIKLWNLDTGKEIRTLSGHTNWIRSVSFSPDGKTLASGSDDNTIKLWNQDFWNLNLDSLMGRNCDWIRNYLQNNPTVSKSDRNLCDDIGTQK